MRPTITQLVLFAMFSVGMFLAGALLNESVLLRESNAIAQDKDALRVVLDECGYSPHPISDVSWELYRQWLIPRGTAEYFTMSVKSVNIPAVECLRGVLPEQWAAPGGP
jgi:hypothetical protein